MMNIFSTAHIHTHLEWLIKSMIVTFSQLVKSMIVTFSQLVKPTIVTFSQSSALDRTTAHDVRQTTRCDSDNDDEIGHQ